MPRFVPVAGHRLVAGGQASGIGQAIVTSGLVLCMVACAPAGEPVPLLTGVDPDACYAGGETGMGGLLLADPAYGTTFNGRPVMWPTGFTAVRVDREVVVLDGPRVVATTGRKYFISIAPVYGAESQHRLETLNAYPAAAKCGYPWDFVDCGTPAPRPSPVDGAEPSCGYHAEVPISDRTARGWTRTPR